MRGIDEQAKQVKTKLANPNPKKFIYITIGVLPRTTPEPRNALKKL